MAGAGHPRGHRPGGALVVELSAPQAVLASCVAWTVVGVLSGLVADSLSGDRLRRDNWVTRLRTWEEDGRVYERLRIRAWKDRLPERGAVSGRGFSKRRLGDRSTAHLERFVVETRRAELVHWANALAGPVFLVWCPPALGLVMVAFGPTVHLPFVVIQRYNRGRLLRLLARRAAPTA